MRRIFLFLFAVMLIGWATHASARAVINELLWTGSHVSSADEWIELYAFDDDADISGYTITKVEGSGSGQTEEVMITIGSGVTIASGGYLLIANYGAEQSHLTIEPHLVTTSVSLPNTKLHMRLRDASGVLLDEIDDGSGAPFAGSIDRDAMIFKSMERIDPAGSGTIAANWQSSYEAIAYGSGITVFATPGTPNSIAPPPPDIPIIINEVLANPSGRDDHEWIELRNTSMQSVGLDNISLHVGSRSFMFGSGETIGAEELLLLTKEQTGLTLSNQGNTVELYYNDILLDALTYDEAYEEVSTGRTSSGATTNMCVPSPSSANTTASIDPQISIQSGESYGVENVTLNLQAIVERGSLSSAQCWWHFGDGYFYEGCNPPSHTLKKTGDYTVLLSVTSQCGNTMSQTLDVTVRAKAGEKPLSLQGGKFIENCSVSTWSGVTLSAAMPNPSGQESEGEWIALRNTTKKSVSLCGWQLDDGEGGSSAFDLDGWNIDPLQSIRIPRSLSKIALNNSKEFVRLLMPVPGKEERKVVLSAYYEKAVEDMTMAHFDRLHLHGTIVAQSGSSIVFSPYAHLQSFGTGSIAIDLTTMSGAKIDGALSLGEEIELIFDSLSSSVSGYEISTILRDGDVLFSKIALDKEKNAVAEMYNGELKMEKKIYEDQVRFSEIYPIPLKGSGDILFAEWIELENISDTDADLSGWILDDDPNGSSKPKVLSGVVIPAGSIAVLRKHQFAVSLNDSGEELSLTSPDGSIRHSVTYPKLKREQSYAFDTSWCQTEKPTPGAKNVCYLMQKEEKSTAIAKKKVISSSIRDKYAFLTKKYRNIVLDSDIQEIHYSDLMEAVRMKFSMINNREYIKNKTVAVEVPGVALLGTISLLSLTKRKLQ